MSKKILLISTTEIIANSVLQDNIEQKLLAKTLSIVQETGLKQILGNAIYTELLTQVENNILSGTTITPFYSSLIEVSKPYLIAKTTSDFIVINNYKFTDKGILKLNDNSATNISEGDLQAIKDYYNNLIATYKKDLIDFLSDNNAIDNDNDIQITSEASGWYLGIPYDICEPPVESNVTEPDEYIEPNVNGFTYQYMSQLNNVLLISIDDIVGQSVIQDNVDVKLLSKTISIVQDVYLKAVLTEKIYFGLLDSVYQNIISGTTQAALYIDLLTFVKPYLINKSVAEFLVPNQYKVSAKGLLKLNDNSATAISEGDLQAVKDYYDNISTTYKISLIEYLNKYNLIDCSDNDITSDATGWFLGSNFNNTGFNLQTQEAYNQDRYTTAIDFTNDTLTLTDNNGGTLSTPINNFITISAATYLGLPSSTGGTVSGLYLPLSGGTVTGDTLFTANLSGNSIYGEGFLDVNQPYNVYDNGYFRGIYINPNSNIYTLGHQSKGNGETVWGITIEGTGTTGQILIGSSPNDVNFGISNGEYYFPKLSDFTTDKMVIVDLNGNLSATTIPTSTLPNPTSTYIPFNDGGIFSDSFIINDNANIVLKTNFNGTESGFNLDYANSLFKFGDFTNNSFLQFDNANTDISLTNNIHKLDINGENTILYADRGGGIYGASIEFDTTNSEFIRLGNYTDINTSTQQNGIYIDTVTPQITIGTFDFGTSTINSAVKVNSQSIEIGTNIGVGGAKILVDTTGDNVTIGSNVVIDTTNIIAASLATGTNTKMVTTSQNGFLSYQDIPIGGSNQTVYYLNSAFQTGTTRTLSPTSVTQAQTGFTISLAPSITGIIAQFLTPIGNPGVINIPPGIWSFYLHANKSDNNSSFRIYCEVLRRTSGGTETSLFFTSSEAVTSVTPNIDMYVSDGFYGGITANTSDRILVKVYAVNASNQTHSVTLITEGTTYYSYATAPFVNLNLLTCENLTACTSFNTVLNNKLDKSGGTITGNLTVTGNTSLQALTATTISATTYNNLPIATTGVTGVLTSSNFIDLVNKESIIIADAFAGTPVTGGTSLTRSLIKSYLIPANTFQTGDFMEIWAIGTKVNANQNWYIQVDVGTGNTLTGAVQLARSFTTASVLYMPLQRIHSFINSTTVRGGTSANNFITETTLTSAAAEVTFRTTVDNYIFFSVYPVTGGSADIFNIERVFIRRARKI